LGRRIKKVKSKLTGHTIALCTLVVTVGQCQVLSMRIGKPRIEASSLLTNGPSSSVNQSASTKRRESSITGRLINESGQPIPNAAVYIRKVGAQANVNRSIGTDQDGRFGAEDLTSGAYSISAYVPGYVPGTDSVDRQYYRPGEAVTLRMIKGGVIAGTVTNPEGEPMVAARVSAVRVRDGEGRAIRGAGASGTSSLRQTDDRGVYRLYGLQSGSYLIVVNGGGASYYPSSAYDGDAPTYHPSTTRDAAAEVTVNTGDEISGIDVRYRGDRGHIVSGTLSGSLGSDPGSRGVSVSLARAASGAIESNTYTSLRGGDRGFALYGVPDGEYDLVAQMNIGIESSAASAPRRVTVKGTDVTGLELALAPLGAIAGRVVLEALPESQRTGDCKDKRGGSPDETVIIARRDEKAGVKEQSAPSILAPSDGTPDGKGEFLIASLIAGRYRIETRLPTEDWFIRSITVPGPAASKQQNDVMSVGLPLSSGQRATDLTVTLAEGAAGLRGKVVPASEGTSLPARLRVHVVPAEADSADSVLRYAEVAVDDGGAFSISNLAPGRYFILARAVSDEEFMERDFRPAAWDATSRTKLRREAAAANVTVELQRCQRIADYSLKYLPPSRAKKPAPRTKP
jgi:hypothetical protein